MSYLRTVLAAAAVALAACGTAGRTTTATPTSAPAPTSEPTPTAVSGEKDVAHSMAFGPDAGLRLLDEIANADVLRDYAPLPAAKGDFLFRAGRLAEARSAFETAAALTRNARERAFLLARAEACDSQR